MQFDILNGNFDDYYGYDIEKSLQAKLVQHESKPDGIVVNNQDVPREADGKVRLVIPAVDSSLNSSSANAVQNAAVTQEINGINSNLPVDAVLDAANEQDGMVPLRFYNGEGDEVFSVDIPAAQEIGEVISPKVTTTLLSPARVKLGDSISMSWAYDCVRTFEGASESVNYPAQTVLVQVKIGTTVVHSESYAQVPVGTTRTLTLGSDVITQPGTVSVSVVATTPIDEEVKTSRGSKTVTVITMDLATTFDPASQLALSNGFTDGQTVTIPYLYTVPTGTTLSVWVDGVLDSTSTISGTGRNYVYLTANLLSAGRHNVQMIAESAGLLSNAVCVDFLKAGGDDAYLGLRLATGVGLIGDMPLPYLYGNTALGLSVAQFEELVLDLAAWRDDSLTSVITVAVDNLVTQTLTADRTLQAISQRFDTAGNHTMTISNGSSLRTFSVVVSAAAGVTETEAVGYRNRLTALGRSNSESIPAQWGGVTTFTGVDWRTNGWQRGSDGVDALLLTNGARAVMDIRPFVLDAQDGDYSIQNGGMTLEVEFMVSQVMERGATVIHCLCDNDGQGYPMGIRVTTEEAGLYFGGVERIKTAEKVTDSEGRYLDINGQVVEDSDDAADLYIVRPHGVSMNIAVDRWVRLAFVVQPVTNGYGLAMLFVNGVLSRANRYTGALRQNTPAGITFDSDKADIRVRSVTYYRRPLGSDEEVDNTIITRPTALQILSMHNANAVGDLNNTTDSDGNIAISHDALLSKGRGILTIIRSTDSGNGLSDLFTCTDKKANFKADLVRWEPPLDANGNPIGDGFEARNVRIRIQGTSSVKYPYKNIRIYLTTQQGTDARVLTIGGVDVTATASGYALRGSGNSVAQSVICAKTDFVDSSLVLNTGGAHLFNDIMHALALDTPPQAYDARVRQSIDGLPCDVYGGTSESGVLVYYGQFVLNNEKSKSDKIFGMSGVKDSNNNTVDFRAFNNGSPVIDTKPIALEALTNSSPMTLFQAAGSASSTALDNQLSAEFDDGFEFNVPEDAKWATIGTGSYADWLGAKTAIKRLMGWIYDCVAQSAGVTGGTMTLANPDYGTSAGWSDASKAKWVSSKFRSEIASFFNLNHLLTYYLFTDYWASVDQRAKNILWRTWDGLIWWATYYDGDTAMSIRNDAFMVYLYNVTRDTFDTERSKFAYEGHNSWLWCLVLANFEDELKTCAANLRNQLTTQVMLQEFNGVMQGNWSERQYNKSGKLKYIDTIQTMNYVYTLTGNRELHRTQFITDRARLLDARYGAGNYNGDVITFTVVRAASDAQSSLTLKSGDLYYFGYKLNGLWLQGPSRADVGETLTLMFSGTLATNDPLMLGGASCIKELDLTNMGVQLNGTVNLSLCVMLSKLVMPATQGVSNAPLTFGDISKLEYVDITGQTAVHTGTAGVFDISKHTRLGTFLAGGTSLTSVKLPEGSPLETLVLPATMQSLSLRYLPKLTHAGLTLQGTANITQLNFAECPNLSWQALMTQCPNIDHVRIEGMSGRVRSSMLRPFMSGFRGLTATGTEQTYPALIGSVQLVDVVDDFDTMQAFFALCGLELTECQYTEYVFDDEETDPANITNMDNRTGYDFRSGAETSIQHPNGYQRSGHVCLIHDRCVPVLGMVRNSTDPVTGVTKRHMHLTPISKSNYGLFPDGTSAANSISDADGVGQDAFLYVPRYHYKGVNDYLNARKHFFLSSMETEPVSTASRIELVSLSSLVKVAGKCLDISGDWLDITGTGAIGVGDDVEDWLGAASSYDTYRVAVGGYRVVRFPGFKHNFAGFAFTDADGKVVSAQHFTMTDIANNPSDFDNEIGDYIFTRIPDGAIDLYFTIPSAVGPMFADGSAFGAIPVKDSLGTVTGYAAILLTDSLETEAVEPYWVEHQPELAGIYSGSAAGVVTGGTATSGLRSLSGKTTSRGNGTSSTNGSWSYDSEGNPVGNIPSSTLNGSAQDFYNLARIRTSQTNVDDGEYTTVPYELSKDMANLMMAWFGTRDVESIIGMGSTPSFTTGIRNGVGMGDTDIRGGSSSNTNGLNKAWGLESWTGSVYEWMDNGCFNAPSFKRFLKDKRNAGSGYVTDYYYNILQQDGNERRVKASFLNQASGVARVRFGRFCDIVASSYTAEGSYAYCYACYQSSNNATARVLGRSNVHAYAFAGVAFSYTNNASSLSYTFYGARLCFFGKIENEEVVTSS